MNKIIIFLLLISTCTGAFGQTRPHWLQLQGSPLVDVRIFGAIGDGVADDTQAIKDTVAHVASREDTDIVYFPKGTYRFLDAGYSIGGVKLWGEGTLVGGNQSPFVLSGPIDVRGLSFSGFSSVFYNGVATESIGDIHIEGVSADSFHTFVNLNLGGSSGPGGGYGSLVVKDSVFTNWNQVFYLSVAKASYTAFNNVQFIQWPTWEPGDPFPGDLQPDDGLFISTQGRSSWGIRLRNQLNTDTLGDFFVTNCTFRNLLRNSDSPSDGRASGMLVAEPSSIFVTNNHFENLIGHFPTFVTTGQQKIYTSAQSAVYGRASSGAVVSGNTIINSTGAAINLLGAGGHKSTQITNNILINELPIGSRAIQSRQENVLIDNNHIRGWQIAVRQFLETPPNSPMSQARITSNMIVEGTINVGSSDNLLISDNTLVLETRTPIHMLTLGGSGDTPGRNVTIKDNIFKGTVDGDNRAAISIQNIGTTTTYSNLRINRNSFNIGNDGAAVDWVMSTGGPVDGVTFPGEFKDNSYYGGGNLFTDRGGLKRIVVDGNIVNSQPFTFTSSATAYFGALVSTGTATWDILFDQP